MSEPVLSMVGDYLGAARWFGGKGRDFDVVAVRRIGLLEPEPGAAPWVGIEVATVAYTGAESETYQVPLAYYVEPQEHLAHALVGSWEDQDEGLVHAYDAMHDPAATALWLRTFAVAAEGPEEVGDLTFHRLPGHELDLTTRSRLFSGEQSNSSLLFGQDSLLKIFRKVTPGANPDVEIHRALTERGSEHVAALYGWLELHDDGDEDGDGDGDAGDGEAEEPVYLAMLQQFLGGAEDGWDLALADVQDASGGFVAEAERLGGATAQVHEVLADQFPTDSWDTAGLVALSETMLTRLEVALTIVPALSAHARPLRAIFSGVADLGRRGRSATVQRVHGDFHLGQTLRTADGWKIVDFEGEPAKTLAERVRPDLPWRDVAGMIRSLDYAAHAVPGTADPAVWAATHEEAFLGGYIRACPRVGDRLSEDQALVLRAYVADKAVYEAVYEARNRPTWLPIPLDAIARLTSTPTISEANDA